MSNEITKETLVASGFTVQEFMGKDYHQFCVIYSVRHELSKNPFKLVTYEGTSHISWKEAYLNCICARLDPYALPLEINFKRKMK
jgi:hypothetical protein